MQEWVFVSYGRAGEKAARKLMGQHVLKLETPHAATTGVARKMNLVGDHYGWGKDGPLLLQASLSATTTQR